MNCPGYIRSYANLLISIAILFLLVSCKPKSLNRPAGYHNLGKLTGLMGGETYLDQHKLFIRRDEKGFYAMSTMCTYDLTYLVKKNVEGKDIWASTYTDSTYDINGKVLSGPSTVNLPYYQLRIDSGTYGGPRDTLYAYVGKEVSPDWRLEIK